MRYQQITRDERCDSHRRAVRNRSPNLFDFLISHGYAPLGPVSLAMKRADKPETVGQTMNHDVAARGDTELFRGANIGCVGVRDVERAMKSAVSLMEIDCVHALWRSTITFLLLVPDRITTQRDAIRLEGLRITNECESAL